MVRSVRFKDIADEFTKLEDFPVKCMTCKKTPKNCRCFEYRLEQANDIGSVMNVWVDNVATDPVRNETVGLWQARRNAKVFRRPQYIDSFGPILSFTNTSDLVTEVLFSIENKTFFLDNYSEREEFIVRSIDKNLSKRLGFLRRPRKPRAIKSS